MEKLRAGTSLAVCVLASLCLLPGCGEDSGKGPGEEEVRTVAITVDGDVSDWGAVKPLSRDATGDAGGRGFDISDFYVARNGGTLYIRIDIADGPVTSEGSFVVAFYPRAVGPGDGEALPYVAISTEKNTCLAYLSVEGDQPIIARGQVAVGGSVIEASIPIEVLDVSLNPYVCCGVESSRTYRNMDGLNDGNVLLTF